ncbi:MAG: ABC transporter substrate-binding protein [Pseudonocardiales bacterium]
MTPRIAERFAGDDRYDIVSVPGEQISLQMPSEDPVFADAQVRRAVGLAIDREAFTAALFGSAGRAAWSTFQPQHWAYDPGVAYDHDPAAAARLLDEAGWLPGPDGVRARNGQPMATTFVHGSSQMDQNIAVFIADTLRGLGMDIELEAVDSFEDRNKRFAAGGVIGSDRPGNAFDPELDLYRTYHSDVRDDDDPSTNRTRMASPATALNPVRRVGSLLTESARAKGVPAGEVIPRLEKATASLGLVLRDVWDRYPHHLSGGMQQRVLIALALLGAPDLVIADEPTSMLDVSSQAAVLDAISTAARETGLGVLLITHNTVLAEYWCEEVRSFADLRSRT